MNLKARILRLMKHMPKRPAETAIADPVADDPRARPILEEIISIAQRVCPAELSALDNAEEADEFEAGRAFRVAIMGDKRARELFCELSELSLDEPN
jgi:hypothetical protein